MKKLLVVLPALVLFQPPMLIPAEPACCGPVSSQGARLLSVLESSNVESLWRASEHVNWETGQPDKGPDYDGLGRSTHCSAFAASIAKRVGIYMLRPPDHGQVLANAQAEWFHSEAPANRAGERSAPRARHRHSPIRAT